MKEKIKNPKGFIRITILLAIIIGIAFIGGSSYLAYTQFKTYQMQQAEKERRSQELLKSYQEALEGTKKEIEGLKEV